VWRARREDVLRLACQVAARVHLEDVVPCPVELGEDEQVVAGAQPA
jgi:hypothetical protein